MIKKQLLAALSSLLGTTGTGMVATFTSTLLPQINLGDDLKSWLAGSNMLSQLLGIVIGGMLMRMYGRKPFIMWLNVPWLIGWVCLSLADRFWIYLVGCIIVGTVAGFFGNLATIYIIEMSEPRFRGFFSGLNSVSFALGILLENVIGVVFARRTALLVTTIVPMLSFFFAFFTPESPNWLILHKHFDKARENFLWLRSETGNSEEFAELLGNDEEDESGVSLRRHISSKPFLKSVFIASLAVTADNIAGFDTITAYSEQIVKNMYPDDHEKTEWIPALIYSMAVLSCAVSCTIIDKFPRRVLFFTSGWAILLSLLAIVVVMTWNLPHYLLIISLCSYQAAGYVGVLTIPWLLSGEIFPDVTREIGSSLCNVFYYTMGFISVKTYLNLTDVIGMRMMYIIYSCLLFVWLIILYFVMPETRGCILQRTEFRPERCDRHEQHVAN